jgi:hypothetical protein
VFLSLVVSSLLGPNIPFGLPFSNTLNTVLPLKQDLKANINLNLMGMGSEDGRLMELTEDRVRRLALVLAVIKFGAALPES